MAWPQLRSCLSTLLPGLLAPATSSHAGGCFRQASEAFSASVERARELAENGTASLAAKVEALRLVRVYANALAALDPPMQAALAGLSHGQPAAVVALDQLVMSLHGGRVGLELASACAGGCAELQPQLQDACRLAAKLLLGSGRRALTAVPVLLASPALQRPEQQCSVEWGDIMLHEQLHLMAHVVGLFERQLLPSQALELVLPPAQLLPWLAAVVAAVLGLLDASRRGLEASFLQCSLRDIVFLCQSLAMHPMLAASRAAMLQDGQLVVSTLNLLSTIIHAASLQPALHGLPFTMAGVAAQAAHTIVGNDAPWLGTAEGREAAHGLLAAAAQLLVTMPLDNMLFQQRCEALRPLQVLSHGATLLASVCYHVTALPAMSNSSSSSRVQHPRRQAQLLLPLMARLAPALQWAVSCGEPQCEGGESLLNNVCMGWSNAAGLLLRIAGLPAVGAPEHSGITLASLKDVADWCQAASAALGALPVLAQAQQRIVQTSTSNSNSSSRSSGSGSGSNNAAEPESHSSAPKLARFICQLHGIVGAMCSKFFDRLDSNSNSRPPDSGQAQDARTALWQLHSAGCRLLHWVGSSPGDVAVLRLPARDSGRWLETLSDLCKELMAAAVLQRLVYGESDQSTSYLPTVHLAHWHAVHAVISGLSDARLEQEAKLCAMPAATALVVTSYSSLALACSRETFELISRVVRHLPKDDVVNFVIAIKQPATRMLAVAAGLLAYGTLAQGIDHVAAGPGGPPHIHPMQLLEVHETVTSVLHSFSAMASEQLLARGLQHAGHATLGSAGTSSSASSAEEASRAMSHLLASVPGQLEKLRANLIANPIAHAAQPAGGTGTAPRQLLDNLQHNVLPQAQDVAAAVLQLLYPSGPHSPAARLELAQVAAARSCAYLRCANLGGKGGPAAGQGVGSQKCSACREVWYCGTACSHADWHAGHRRVCKALTAMRQERQAAVTGTAGATSTAGAART